MPYRAPMSGAPTVLAIDLPAWFAGSLAEECPFELVRVSCGSLASFVERHGGGVYVALIGDADTRNEEDLLMAVALNSSPPLHLVAVGSLETADVERYVRAGYSGALRLETPAGEVCRAIRAVADGELWFPRKVLSTVLRSLRTSSQQKRLTQRERDVMRLMAQGYNNREIAGLLCVTRETVRWHMRGVYAKIGTHCRKKATAYAQANEEHLTG